MYRAPANCLGPVGVLMSSPAEMRLPVAGSILRMYLVKMLRSPSEVLVPPGLLKFPWMVESAEIVFRGRTSPTEPRPESKVFSTPQISR